jgi:hypothetical protein
MARITQRLTAIEVTNITAGHQRDHEAEAELREQLS